MNMAVRIPVAPGARVVIRDEEWIVRRMDPSSDGGDLLVCDGVSELVRGRTVHFLTALEGRIAVLETIASTPAFAGLRVGLYVGGRGDTSPVMTKTSVITDRDAMRKAPPDVLLTNYKMLDYLLVRPRDRALWEHNAPDTLRYVVVDELHTFDGAQGTDLALLLRRLRARLGTPAGQLIC